MSNNEYMRKYMLNRYYNRRKEATELLGGHCVDCSTEYNLEFDHIDPKQKTYDIGKCFTSMKWDKVLAELSKCELRCYTCHKIKTEINGENKNVSHGGGKTGKRNCRCELCKPLKNEYERKRKQLKRAGNSAGRELDF